jgi:hypothetical protein
VNIPAEENETVKRLWLAVVIQAVTDYKELTRKGRIRAGSWRELDLKEWLLGSALFILESYDIPILPEDWTRYIEDGCPGEFPRLTSLNIKSQDDDDDRNA